MRKHFVVVSLLAAFTFTGCTRHRDLRGSFVQSPDGKTYLVVVGDQSNCKSLKVDGKIWSHPLDQAGLIEPGEHSINCDGAEIGFIIRSGVVYKFDYWGP